MAQHQAFVQALCISSLALTVVLSARVDDEEQAAAHQPAGAINKAGSFDFPATAGLGQPLGAPEQQQQLQQQLDATHHTGYFPLPHGESASSTRTQQTLANTLIAHREVQSARSSAHLSSAYEIHGAQVQSAVARALANKQAVAHDKLVVGQAHSQTTAQRHAQAVAHAHANEAASAHTHMVQSQEMEKIHMQEANLAHAQAVTERRAIEVHKKAEKRIKEIEKSRALAIQDINSMADREVADTHGGALKGIEDVTQVGKQDASAVRSAHQETQKQVNAEVQADAAKGYEVQAQKAQDDAAFHGSLGWREHPAPPAEVSYATEGLGTVEHTAPPQWG